MRTLKLSGHVGFDSLPDQLVNKSVQNGFVFNILCIGKLTIIVYNDRTYLIKYLNCMIHQQRALVIHPWLIASPFCRHYCCTYLEWRLIVNPHVSYLHGYKYCWICSVGKENYKCRLNHGQISYKRLTKIEWKDWPNKSTSTIDMSQCTHLILIMWSPLLALLLPI